MRQQTGDVVYVATPNRSGNNHTRRFPRAELSSFVQRRQVDQSLMEEFPEPFEPTLVSYHAKTCSSEIKLAG